MEISLAGSYQIINAALALEGVMALRTLGWRLERMSRCEAVLLATKWRGRFDGDRRTSDRDHGAERTILRRHRR